MEIGKSEAEGDLCVAYATYTFQNKAIELI